MEIAASKRRKEIRYRYRYRSIHKRYSNAVTPLHDVAAENKASGEAGEKALRRIRRLAFLIHSLSRFAARFWKRKSQIYHNGEMALAESPVNKGLNVNALLIVNHKVRLENGLEIMRRLPTIQGFNAHFGGRT